MKKLFLFCTVAFVFITMPISFNSCKKKVVPALTPLEVENPKNDSVLQISKFVNEQKNANKFLSYKIEKDENGDTLGATAVFVYQKQRYTIFAPKDSFISFAVRPNKTTDPKLLKRWTDEDFDGKINESEKKSTNIPEIVQEKYVKALKDFYSKFKLE